MLSICIVIASIAAAAYLISKVLCSRRFVICRPHYFRGSRLHQPGPFNYRQKATHLAGLDVIQIFTNLLQTRTAGLGMNIMAIAGFTYFMDQIGASGALVRLSVKPLKLIKAPYIVMTLGFILSLILNVFIPSAAGLALLLMVSLYPVMVMGGISRQSAAATILVGGCCCLGRPAATTFWLLISQRCTSWTFS